MSHVRRPAGDHASPHQPAPPPRMITHLPTSWPRPRGVALGWHLICFGVTLDSFSQKGLALGSHEPQNGPELQARLGLIAGPRLSEVSRSMTEFVPWRSSLLGPLLASVLWKGLLGQRRQTRSAGHNSGLARATASPGPLALDSWGAQAAGSRLKGEGSWSPSLPGGFRRRVCELNSLSKDATVMDGCFLAKPTEVGPRISKH